MMSETPTPRCEELDDGPDCADLDSWVELAFELEQELTAERAARERAESERDALRAEVERLREDAERYLWLRNKARTVDWSCWIEDRAFIRHCRIEADRMDAVIDAARKERP